MQFLLPSSLARHLGEYSGRVNAKGKKKGKIERGKTSLFFWDYRDGDRLVVLLFRLGGGEREDEQEKKKRKRDRIGEFKMSTVKESLKYCKPNLKFATTVRTIRGFAYLGGVIPQRFWHVRIQAFLEFLSKATVKKYGHTLLAPPTNFTTLLTRTAITQSKLGQIECRYNQIEAL